MITLIAAVGNDRIIGNEGKLPWECPPDIAFFKQNTLNKAVIMGRKTYEFLEQTLTDRLNIVVTRNPAYRDNSGAVFASTISQAIAMGSVFSTEVFIIGGEEVFTQALPLADRLLITELDYNGPGDTRFPVISPNRWHRNLMYNGNCIKNGLEYTIIEYWKIKPFSVEGSSTNKSICEAYVEELLTSNKEDYKDVY